MKKTNDCQSVRDAAKAARGHMCYHDEMMKEAGMTPLIHTPWSKRFDSTTGRWEIFDAEGSRVCRLKSAKTKSSEPAELVTATAIEWTPGLLTAVSQVLEAFGDFELGEHPAISNLRATYEKAAMK